MLTIGDFSKLSRVPITALRYYDEMGLLIPIEVEHFSNYRYYSVSQLPRLNRILALKDLGFSLEQIARVLNEGLSLEQLQGMFRLKQAELQQRVIQEQERLARVEARLRQIEQEKTMPNYDVIVKNVEPQLVASLRRTIPRYQDVGQLFYELGTYCKQYKVDGVTAAIWHEEGYTASNVDAEAVVYLKSRLPETEHIKVYELPATTMASLVHHGAYNAFNQAYEAMDRWIEANGYKITGYNRELYLHCTQPVRQDDESYVSELQFPVQKV